MRGLRFVALTLGMGLVCAHAAGAAGGITAAASASPQVPAPASPPDGQTGPYRTELDAIAELNKAERAVEAIEAARKLLARVEEVEGPDSLAAAAALHALGSSLAAAGKYDEGEILEVAKRALAIREQRLAPGDLQIATSLYLIEDVLYSRGKYVDALPFNRRAYEIRVAALGTEHPDVGRAARRLGVGLLDTGDLSGARPLLERALAISERTFGPQSRQVGEDLINLGAVTLEMGDYEAALAYHNRALLLLEPIFGPESPATARLLDAKGLDQYWLDDFAGAIETLGRALAILDKSDKPQDALAKAWVLNRLSNVYLETRDTVKARECLERAIAIVEGGWPDNAGLGPLLVNLTWFQRQRGEFAAALATLERAAPLINFSWPGDNAHRVTLLLREASLRLVTGDLVRAEQAATEALGIAERAHGPDKVVTAEACFTLAEVYAVAGDNDRAALLFDRSLAFREKAVGPVDSSLGIELYRAARFRAVAGHPQEAVAAALRSERILREHLRPTARVLSERELLDYTKAAAGTLGLALTVTAQSSGREAPNNVAVLDSLVRSRGLVLDEVALRHRVGLTAADPAVKQLGKELAAARTRLANLSVRGPDGDELRQYEQRLDDARNEKERAERALAERSAVFSQQMAARDIGLDAVAASLAAGDALVAFARYERHDLRKFLPDYVPRQRSFDYLAFVQRKGSAGPVPVPLGPAKDIDALIARWREAVAGPARNADSTSARGEAEYRRVAADLRRKVWDPVAAHLAGATRVFIVPDAALHLVNFAALPSGTASYLAEVGPKLHYLSTERDLVTARPSTTTRQGLLAIGNPAFDGRPQTIAAGAPAQTATGEPAAEPVYRGPRPTCGGFPSLRFTALPASGKEVREVAALWDERRDQRSASAAANTDHRREPALLLTGAAASEASFKQAAPGQRILHLATHGFFLGGECASDVDGVPTTSSASPLRAVTTENPLLLSGLVLAGANHRQSAGPGDEDGILTAEEVAALDLSGTEWAVLSACNTGVGEVRAGEGVFGLRRAFQVAGARTVIMSLWPVDDEAARLWMAALYRQHFVEAKTTADAVYGADLELLQQRRQKGRSTHPFYWAGFVAAGDWR